MAGMPLGAIIIGGAQCGIVEGPDLNSSDVLARPFDLERKGFVASIAGKTVPQDIIVGTGALPIVRRDQKR